MNTKTNAPADVAQLDKGADKSPKQAAVQTVQAIKPASSAAHQTKKGNEVATAEKTPSTAPAVGESRKASVKEQISTIKSSIQAIVNRMGGGKYELKDAEDLVAYHKSLSALDAEHGKVREHHTNLLSTAGLDPHEVYSKEAIQASYLHLFPKAAGTTAAPTTARVKPEGATSDRTEKPWIVSKRVDGKTGAPAKILKEGEMADYIKDGLLLLRGKTQEETNANVKAAWNPEEQEFLSTPEGKKRFKEAAEWVHTARGPNAEEKKKIEENKAAIAKAKAAKAAAAAQ